MKEAYVKFDTAKRLKEKGFNGHCHVIHINNHNSLIGKVINNLELTTTHEYKFCKDKENCITIPTQQMAIRWLRWHRVIFVPASHNVALIYLVGVPIKPVFLEQTGNLK